MKEKYTFEREIRRVVRRISAVALCALIVTASAQGGTPTFYKEAEAGQAWAQYEVGVSYAKGKGVSKDMAEAVKWFRKAAEQGDEAAQCKLGLCYANGEGVSKDFAEAVKWYRKAAEQGYAMAQCLLGACYETGEGVSKDMTEAVKWYRKAAEQGDEPAKFMLERLEDTKSILRIPPRATRANDPGE